MYENIWKGGGGGNIYFYQPTNESINTSISWSLWFKKLYHHLLILLLLLLLLLSKSMDFSLMLSNFGFLIHICKLLFTIYYINSKSPPCMFENKVLFFYILLSTCYKNSSFQNILNISIIFMLRWFSMLPWSSVLTSISSIMILYYVSRSTLFPKYIYIYIFLKLKKKLQGLNKSHHHLFIVKQCWSTRVWKDHSSIIFIFSIYLKAFIPFSSFNIRRRTAQKICNSPNLFEKWAIYYGNLSVFLQWFNILMNSLQLMIYTFSISIF